MKVVINNCFGGFSLSARATERLAELNGRKCYLFRRPRGEDFTVGKYEGPITAKEADGTYMFFAFDVPTPTETLRGKGNATYKEHDLNARDVPRNDPRLIQVVEELGKAASGAHADLKIIEIPDDVEFEIAEYDGNEHIAEAHRKWY